MLIVCFSVNYPGYDPNLNVVTSESLLNNCFYNIDVVSVFDNIPMSRVINVLKNYIGRDVPGGYLDMREMLN